MRVDTRAHREVLGKACFREGATVLCVLEQPIQPIAISLIDETARLRRVVETDVREPLGDCSRITACTRRVLERKLPIAACTHDRHIGRAARCRGASS